MTKISVALGILSVGLCGAFAQQGLTGGKRPLAKVKEASGLQGASSKGREAVAPKAVHKDCQIDGRNLEAYEAAANYLRRAKDKKTGLPSRIANISNYAVVFEEDQGDCYVMHFLSGTDSDKVTGLDYSPDDGLPFRFYVRKKDLVVVKAVLE